MSTTEETLCAADIEHDTRALMNSIATGAPLDPAIARRIRERAERIRQKTFETHGVLDIGVPSIRALRDGDDA